MNGLLFWQSKVLQIQGGREFRLPNLSIVKAQLEKVDDGKSRKTFVTVDVNSHGEPDWLSMKFVKSADHDSTWPPPTEKPLTFEKPREKTLRVAKLKYGDWTLKLHHDTRVHPMPRSAEVEKVLREVDDGRSSMFFVHVEVDEDGNPNWLTVKFIKSADGVEKWPPEPGVGIATTLAPTMVDIYDLEQQGSEGISSPEGFQLERFNLDRTLAPESYTLEHFG